MFIGQDSMDWQFLRNEFLSNTENIFLHSFQRLYTRPYSKHKSWKRYALTLWEWLEYQLIPVGKFLKPTCVVVRMLNRNNIHISYAIEIPYAMRNVLLGMLNWLETHFTGISRLIAAVTSSSLIFRRHILIFHKLLNKKKKGRVKKSLYFLSQNQSTITVAPKVRICQYLRVSWTEVVWRNIQQHKLIRVLFWGGPKNTTTE